MPNLDYSQRNFCESSSRNIRLLAPAGSGKTLSLAHRCLHLTNKESSSKPRFLIVTFTVAAKQEFSSRLDEEEKFHPLRDQIEITTLNSWGFRRIKSVAFHPKLVTSSNDHHFAMLNQLQPIWKQHKAVRHAIEEKKNTTPRKLMELMDGFKSIGFDHENHSNFEMFESYIDLLHKQGLHAKWYCLLNELARLRVIEKPANTNGDELPDFSARTIYNSFFKFWRAATKHLIENDTFTLEDQKYFAYLDEKKKLADGKLLAGAARYDHVLVDEFQDINPLDLALIKTVADRNRATLTIVGDDDQAIFEWRGATPKYIVSPETYFGRDFDTFILNNNYRSPTNVVSLAQKLIEYNDNRVKKNVSSQIVDEAHVELVRASNLSNAMDRVIQEYEIAIADGVSPSKIAIIGRKRSQIIPYQLYFASNEVPFCAAEDLQIFMSGAFDRLMRLIMTKCESHMYQLPTRIVDQTIELCNVAKRYPLSKKDRESIRSHLIRSRPKTMEDAVGSLAGYTGPLKGKNKNGETSLGIAKDISSFIKAKDVASTLSELANSFQGLQTDLGKAEDDVFYVDPPFLHLIEYAIRYGNDYARFVEDIDLAKEKLAYIPPFEDDAVSLTNWKRPVHLMTALRSKGKEFDTVIMLDTNQGIWPNRNAQTIAEIEAERRVFYVAFTRAKKRLVLIATDSIRNSPVELSQFVLEAGLA